MTGPDEPEEEGYTLRISRLTIDKLGVKLYDRVSAVVAELIANAYDADAENVWVELPLTPYWPPRTLRREKLKTRVTPLSLGATAMG